MEGLSRLAYAISLFAVATAQYFPPIPENVNTIQSKFGNGVSISYKEPGVCETTPGVRSYAGYVHLPPGILADVNVTQDYPINTFFWFFESRKDPANAPLSIWMNGGPGSSSLIGLLQENGPCNINNDSNSTTLNPWSWNNEVNMLYIDQPNQVGFSYDVPTNGTRDLVSGNTTAVDFSTTPIPEQNNTFYVGTFSSENQNTTTNDTQNSARALWHFAQAWFQEFPAYKPNDDRISIWTESYGGRYGPAFAAFFQRQNERISSGTLNETGESFYLHLDTLGIINGCIDLLTQELSYPEFAYNNTYGIQSINQTVYQRAVDAFTKPGGCRDRIVECNDLAAVGDPDFIGNNITVNLACQDADSYCSNNVEGPYILESGRNYYDITAVDPDPFPDPYFLGFLSQHWVQGALGVPVNYTISVDSVYYAFSTVGDYPRKDVRGGYLADLAYLLDSGVKVALMYGDRDYACNWVGGETASLAVNYSSAPAFAAAGYADIQVNSSYVGGQVRQHGNFSFSRVYQAGHEVPSYQPEAAYRIFQRSLFNTDIATGAVSTAEDGNYSTQGSPTTFEVKNTVPESAAPTCYVLQYYSTCTDDARAALLNGTALVHNYIVIDENTTSLFPGVSGNGSSGSGNGTGGGSVSSSGGGNGTGNATLTMVGGLVMSTSMSQAAIVVRWSPLMMVWSALAVAVGVLGGILL